MLTDSLMIPSVTALEIYSKCAVSPFITLPKVTTASNVLCLFNKHFVKEGISKAPGTSNISKSFIKKLLLTNNPKKIVSVEGFGLEIVDRIPIEFDANEINKKYLSTKRDKLGHLIMENLNK